MITIKIDRERMSEVVTVDEYLQVLDGDVRTTIKLLSLFVLGDDGKYLPKDEGRRVIGKLTLAEMEQAVASFSKKAEEIAVPPSSGVVSD